MGNTDSADADLFDGIDDSHLPSMTRIDERPETPAIIHIKPKYQSKVLRLEEVSPKMSWSPVKIVSREMSFGSMSSFIQRKCSPKKSPVYFESSASAKPSIAVEQAVSPQDHWKTTSRKTGPTEPRLSPIVPSVSLNFEKNKQTGPTIPGPTAPPDDDSSEDSNWSSSSGSILHKPSKNDMHNWTDEWKGVKAVQGLYDVEKSDSLSACEIHEFFEHKAAEERNMARSPRLRLNSRTSIRSKASALSALSGLSRVPAISVFSDTSSISDHSNASSSVHIQTFADLMPTAAWASPHYKDYEEKPYDPYKSSGSQKTKRSFKKK